MQGSCTLWITESLSMSTTESVQTCHQWTALFKCKFDTCSCSQIADSNGQTLQPLPYNLRLGGAALHADGRILLRWCAAVADYPRCVPAGAACFGVDSAAAATAAAATWTLSCSGSRT